MIIALLVMECRCYFCTWEHQFTVFWEDVCIYRLWEIYFCTSMLWFLGLYWIVLYIGLCTVFSVYQQNIKHLAPCVGFSLPYPCSCLSLFLFWLFIYYNSNIDSSRIFLLTSVSKATKRVEIPIAVFLPIPIRIFKLLLHYPYLQV